EGWAHSGLATVAGVEGRLLESFERMEQADRALAAAGPGYPDLHEFLLMQWGQLFLRMNRLDEAMDSLERFWHRQLHSAEGRKRLAEGYLTASRIHRLRGELDQAEEAIARALSELDQASNGTRASVWMARARLDFEASRFSAAEEALSRAMHIAAGNPRWIANILADRAEMELHRDRWDESLALIDEATRLFQKADSPDLNFFVHASFLKSRALLRIGQAEGSQQTADRGLLAIEAVRNEWSEMGLEFFAVRAKYFRHRFDLAFAQNQTEEFSRVFEEFRARGLLASTEARNRGQASRPGPAVAKELEQARKELFSALVDLDLLDPSAPESRRQEHVQRLRDKSLRLDWLRTKLRGPADSGVSLAPADYDAVLDDETLALSLTFGRESAYVLIRRRDRAEVAALPGGRADLEELLEEVRLDLTPGLVRDQVRAERNIVELSRLLLGPIAAEIAPYRRLVIVADGAFENLPFEALRHPGTERFLIESHEVVYEPSHAVLARLRQTHASCAFDRRDPFLLGDPIFGSRRDERWPQGVEDVRQPDEVLEFQRLPASAEEVGAIAALYSGGASVYTGNEATRDRVLSAAAHHPILHIASHARSHRENPQLSKIALSCLDDQGEILRPCDLFYEDVASLDLCGQLVILSACQSAGGSSLAGEGILGLPRVFLAAGASTVIASLWAVDDTLTAQLMIDLHRQLQGGLAPAAALRAVKKDVIARQRPASEWAAFILLGDWRATPGA
ncbi:MAG: CHAT domain-containing protein, partial [Acidobacteriota bacterium]